MAGLDRIVQGTSASVQRLSITLVKEPLPVGTPEAGTKYQATFNIGVLQARAEGQIL